jgi:hypothetical protein
MLVIVIEIILLKVHTQMACVNIKINIFKNYILSRTSPGTLARDLIDNGGDRTIEMVIKKRIRLEGSELEEYMQLQQQQRLHTNNTVK